MSNLLDRRASIASSSHPFYNLNAGQIEQDQILRNFVHEASDWKSIASMMAGGLAYKLGNIAYLKSIPTTLPLLSKLTPAAGLFFEVSAFRASHHFLNSGEIGVEHAPGIFSGKEFVTDYINFGTLKFFGNISHGHNPVFAHLSQDIGMVTGHQLAYGLNLATKPEGSLVQQLFHAEASNLALGAGTSLAHHLSGSRLHSWEKVLEINRSVLQKPLNRLQLSTPLVQMSTGAFKNPIEERRSALSQRELKETQDRLLSEWQKWKRKKEFSADQLQRIEKLLPIYAEYCLIHLGRETAPQLPYLEEVYEMSQADFFSKTSEKISEADRVVLLRFLSTQEGRRSFGERTDESALSSLQWKVSDTRQALGQTHDAYADFARRRADELGSSPLERAQIYQRGLSLLHFYTAELLTQHQGSLPKPFADLPFERKALERVYADSLAQVYPEKSIQIFSEFWRTQLHQEVPDLFFERGLEKRFGSLNLFSVRSKSFLESNTSETWAEHLTRMGITRGQLTAADLGIAGVTIFNWGSNIDTDGRISVPGDILNLLSVITYLNSSAGKIGVDPFVAARLTLAEQLHEFTPNERGEVVIRYPKIMEGLDYEHFGLGALLRAHIASHADTRDIDLARQWGVSEGTVAEYRKGVVRKMLMETLDKLADSLSSNPEQKKEIRNFLIFLRYRAYFNATLAIEDLNGTALNHKPPQASQVKIVLAPMEGDLKSVDPTRRVQFEREPFASVINGSVNLALDLLEQRKREFEIIGIESVPLPDTTIKLGELSSELQQWREQHTEYSTTLSEHEQRPSILKPGELQRMQDFYRYFFRRFEAIYLHSRPSAVLGRGELQIEYEIVPPTSALPRGTRFAGSKAHVVAADLFRLGQNLEPATLNALIQLRVLREYLKTQGLPETELKTLAERVGIQGPLNEWIEQLDRLELASESEGALFVDASENAILHRITREKIYQSQKERRRFHWQEDLSRYAEQEGIASLQENLENAFSKYLEKAEHPYRQFNAEAFEESLLAVTPEATEAAQLRSHLLNFMKRIGIASSEAPPSSRVSAESMAAALFATYLNQSRNMHPLAIALELTTDKILLERITDDRLADYSELAAERDNILGKIQEKITAYNQRAPLLKVHEVKAEEVHEPFTESLLDKIYEETLLEIEREEATLRIHVSREKISRAYHKLSAKLVEALPTEVDLEASDLNSHEKTVLQKLSQNVRAKWIAIERIADLAPAYVQQERYLSGLENSAQLGREVRSIFLRHFRSHLFETQALNFTQAIAAEYEMKFGPYEKIQSGVVRGVQVVYQNLLRHHAAQYAELKESVELAREEASNHRSLEQFWETCLEFGKALDPRIQNKDQLLERIEDFEHFLAMLSWNLTLDLKKDILQKAKEIEELPPLLAETPPPAAVETKKPELVFEAREVLKGEISDALLDHYSELLLVEDVALLAQLEGKAERHALAVADARALVQLLALFELYRKDLSANAQESIDEIILDIETSGDPLAETTRRAFEDYRTIQTELVSKIPLVEYVGTLPEIRNGRKSQTGEAVHFAIHNQITRRALPKLLTDEFDKEVQAALTRSHNLDEKYFAWLIPFYLRNRNTILNSTDVKILPTSSSEIIPGQRERLYKDYPELSLADVASHQKEMAHMQAARVGLFEHNAKAHELLVLHAFMHRYFASLESKSALQKAASEILAEYTRLFALVSTGASIPHVLKEAHDRIFTIYRKNHAEILVHVAQREGAEKVISLLPEIAALSFNPREGWQEIPEIVPGFADSAQTFQKVVWRIQRGSTKSNVQQELEKLLWDFDPTHQGGEDPEIAAATAEMQKNVYYFYLRHRNSLSHTPRFHGKALKDNRNYDSYWELNAFPVDSIKERQKATLHLLNRPLSAEPALLMQVRNRYGKTEETLVNLSERDRFVESFGGEERVKYEAPFTKLHRMYNSVLSLMSPNMRALFNEASSHSTQTRKIEMDTYRAMTLLYLGVDPAWVIDRFQQRVLDYYDQHRTDILSRTSFAELAINFEEIRAVPGYEIDRIVRVFARTGKGNPVLSRDNELFIRLYAIVCQHGHDDKAVNEMLRGNPPEDGNLSIEKVNENATRYYLRNMKKLFRTFRPWITSTEQHILQVRYHPLISGVNPQDAIDMAIAGPRGVDRESPDYDLMKRIVAVVEHVDVPRKIQEEFRKTWNRVRPQSTESLTRAMVNFFVANEEAIQHAYDRINARR